MIIVGVRSLTSTGSSGQFRCPYCGNGSPYWEKRTRTWFTLYFVPVLPISGVSGYIECGRCAQAYDPKILEYDPQGEREAFGRTLTDALVRLAMEDGTFTVEERNAILDFYRRTTDRDLPADELTAIVDRVRREGSRFVTTVRPLAASWSGEALTWFIHAAFQVACADGEMTPEKERAISELPGALGVSKQDFQKVIAASAESEQETDA